MSFTQICILILGSSSIYIVGRKEPWRKWGFLIGLCGQPFWFYTAYTTQQWGILIMCLFYTYSWGNGVYTHIFPAKDLKGKPLYRFHKGRGLEKNQLALDGDGTEYVMLWPNLGLQKRTGRCFMNDDGSINLDGFIGRKLVDVK